MLFSERVETALTLAERRHRGQTRKGSDVPYVTHLVHVALILAAHGEGEDAIIVSLLHDIVEDTCAMDDDVRAVEAEILARFGRDVAEAVSTLTEIKRGPDGSSRPWRLRKLAYMDGIEKGPLLALKVSAADKIHNASTLLADLRREGEKVWLRFHASPEDSLWYYESVASIVRRRLGGGRLADELDRVILDLRALATTKPSANS